MLGRLLRRDAHSRLGQPRASRQRTNRYLLNRFWIASTRVGAGRTLGRPAPPAAGVAAEGVPTARFAAAVRPGRRGVAPHGEDPTRPVAAPAARLVGWSWTLCRRRRLVTTTDWLMFAILCLTALALGASLLGPRLLCWLLGHRVGLARIEPSPGDAGNTEPVRVSRCVRCQRPFTD